MDVNVREMITANAVYQWYMTNNFWPAINKAASEKPDLSLAPYHKITPTIRAILAGDKLAPFIDEVFKVESQRNDPAPSLRDRLENVGHDEPSMTVTTDITAAAQYLGGSLKNVIDLMDKLWLNNQMNKKK